MAVAAKGAAATDVPDASAPAKGAAATVAVVAVKEAVMAAPAATAPAAPAVAAGRVPMAPAPMAAAINRYCMNSRIRTAIWTALVVVAILVVGAFAAVRYVIPNLTSQPTQTTADDAASAFVRSQYESAKSAHDTLKSDNAAYAQANQLRLAGKYADAAVAYRSALAGVTDVAQRTEIKFWLAYSEEASGDYAGSVATYKEIAAASTTLSRLVRAHAVQNLALMYYRFGDPVITKEIFKSYPYKRFYNPKYIPLSYRNVFDYAASLYPLALSEAYSADWYANQLLAGTTTRPEYKVIIREKLQLAEKDLESVRNDASQRNTFLIALERRAVVLGKMRRTGDASFADPEAAFKELLNYYVTFRMDNDGTARLQYAYYLARAYGKDRAVDIQTILAPINADLGVRGTSVAPFLKGARLNRLNTKANLVLLASIDPSFKKTLLSLSWVESDFKE